MIYSKVLDIQYKWKKKSMNKDRIVNIYLTTMQDGGAFRQRWAFLTPCFKLIQVDAHVLQNHMWIFTHTTELITRPIPLKKKNQKTKMKTKKKKVG